MIINIEWGAFGDNNDILKRTVADDQVDKASLNPGRQKFEKNDFWNVFGTNCKVSIFGIGS